MPSHDPAVTLADTIPATAREDLSKTLLHTLRVQRGLTVEDIAKIDVTVDEALAIDRFLSAALHAPRCPVTNAYLGIDCVRIADDNPSITPAILGELRALNIALMKASIYP